MQLGRSGETITKLTIERKNTCQICLDENDLHELTEEKKLVQMPCECKDVYHRYFFINQSSSRNFNGFFTGSASSSGLWPEMSARPAATLPLLPCDLLKDRG